MADPTPAPAPAPAPEPAPNPAPSPAQEPAPSPAPAPAPSPFYSSLPEDWRDQLASAGFEGEEVEKVKNQLTRYKDMPSMVKALREAQKKISSGQAKAPLPENPTPEDLASYREANGIPAEYTGYQIELPDGVDILPADRGMFDSMLKVAHEGNLRPDQVNKMVNAMAAQRDAWYGEIQVKDKLEAQSTADTLKREWGPDFERNKNLVMNLLAQELPREDRDALLNARLSGGEGSGVFNSPVIMNMLAKIARERAPAPTVVPSGAAGKSHDQIEQMYKEKMREDGWDKSQDKKDYLAYLDSRERNAARK